MKRRTPATKRHEIDVLSNAGDYGTAFVTARDGRRKPAPIGASQGVELADVADIDRPDKRVTVRVARRVDSLIAILDPKRKDNAPGQARYLAAEQFRFDAAVADGASGEGDRLGGVSGGSGGRDGMAIAKLDAQGRVRRAWLAIRGHQNDAELADVTRLIVLGYATLTVVEAARRYRSGTPKQLLLIALDRLAGHYGLINAA